MNGGADYLFGGKSREPSVENFRSLQDAMKSSRARLVVGFMNDGDGDRFVGGGRDGVLVMNKYGPIVVRYLSGEHGVRGDATRSVMTSHMADAALARYLPAGRLHETAVGFQHMKEFIADSVNSWEESDGMSPKGWSRDKDGLARARSCSSTWCSTTTRRRKRSSPRPRRISERSFSNGARSPEPKQGDALTAALAARFGGIGAGDTITARGPRTQGRPGRHARRIQGRLRRRRVVRRAGERHRAGVRPYVETFAEAGGRAGAPR